MSKERNSRAHGATARRRNTNTREHATGPLQLPGKAAQMPAPVAPQQAADMPWEPDGSEDPGANADDGLMLHHTAAAKH